MSDGDRGIDQEELDEYFPDLGIKVLHDNWEEGVPELIGFKPEWIDGVSMDGCPLSLDTDSLN